MEKFKTNFIFREFIDGIKLMDENNCVVGESRLVAGYAIPQVVISRILMATPYMIITPLIINRLDKKNFFKVITFLINRFINK